MLWFTSDLHFGHRNVIDYSNRPFFSIEQMNEELIKNWNSCVKPNDTIYNLGDFFLTRPKDIVPILDRLNGNIILIKGNHDKHWIKKVNHPKLKSVHDYLEINVDANLIVLMHFPIERWNKSHYGSLHLHGHCHGNGTIMPNRLDVGVDNAYKLLGQYKPFSLNEVYKNCAKSP